jgi:DNA-binding NarL/FixJ family response regulator
LIVTRDQALRESLAKPLRHRHDFETVAVSENIQLALEKCQKQPADVILFDFNGVVTDCMNDIQTLRSHLPRTPVVVLAHPEESVFIGRLTEAGASGWLLKGTSRDRIAHALRLGKYRGPATGTYPAER